MNGQKFIKSVKKLIPIEKIKLHARLKDELKGKNRRDLTFAYLSEALDYIEKCQGIDHIYCSGYNIPDEICVETTFTKAISVIRCNPTIFSLDGFVIVSDSFADAIIVDYEEAIKESVSGEVYVSLLGGIA